MKTYRHGDVVIKEIDKDKLPAGAQKLSHLTLALGEVTGHSHRISSGQAALSKFNNKTYLEIQDKLATLTHEEHKEIELPTGTYEIIIQREYDDEKEWRNVLD